MARGTCRGIIFSDASAVRRSAWPRWRLFKWPASAVAIFSRTPPAQSVRCRMGAMVEIDGLHDHMQAAVVGIEGDIPLRIAPNAAERRIAGACARDQPLVVPHRTRDAA